MNPKATCLVYILQLDGVTAVSKSHAELWGSYLQVPWAASQNTEMYLCSSYYRWLGAVWLMFSVLYRTCAFHWQHESSMKDVVPLHLKSVSDPVACQIYSLGCRSLGSLGPSEEGTVGTLLSCVVAGLLFYLEYGDISTFQEIESQSFGVFPPSIHFCLKDQTIFF